MFNSFDFLADKELKKYLKVFSLISKPFLYKFARFYAQDLSLPIPPIYPATLIYRHFIGGSNLSQTLPIILSMREKNIHTILDYAIESSEHDEVFEKNLNVFVKTLEFCHQHNIPFLAIKPSSLARKKDMLLFSSETLTAKHLDIYKSIKRRFFEIFKKAQELNISVLVDAEESWYQPFVDRLVWEGVLNFNKDRVTIWNTIQLYRKDRLEFMENEIRTARLVGVRLGYKLVRGAYHEQEINYAKQQNIEPVVFEKKEDTDHEYNKAVELSFENLNIVKVMLATHNKKSILHAINLFEKYRIHQDDSRVWFSQLYGMGDYLTYPLANMKYNVAKYLPFAPFSKAIPYMIRRLEENSSGMTMAKEEYHLLKQEVNRRYKPSGVTTT